MAPAITWFQIPVSDVARAKAFYETVCGVKLEQIESGGGMEMWSFPSEQRAGEISGALKQLAKDEQICVVLLAQLNRASEARDDKRPTLADLRDSGELEQDADVVVFVYREAYYLERSPEFRRNEMDARAKASEKAKDAEKCQSHVHG